ncbi:MAG TPA: Uma2 family endonuclease [Thermoanaerobaculia bacterium]|jgi:Uma2 family endonuclease
MTASTALRFTYQDYLLLPEDRRYEVIDGDLFMTPAPTPYHQLVSKRIERLIDDFVEKNGLGLVLYAPCDVVLSETDVVQPDILFVSASRISIVGDKFISAAPDLIVEVLSPATETRDRVAKTKLYAKKGVRELWIADPEARTIEVLVNSGEGFRRDSLAGAGETLRSVLLEGLEIPLSAVF